MKGLQWLLAPALVAAALDAQAAPQTVDVLVLYTADAVAHRNGRDIDARIASYIEFANRAYEKSGVDLRMRLVHKQLLDWTQYRDVTSANLDRFKDDANVLRLREQYGADVVSLINLSADAGGGMFTCGIGYMGSAAKNSGTFYAWSKDMAFNLVGVDCGLNTFAHEAGHNMGLRHSFEQDQSEGYYRTGGANSHSGTYEWSRGYGVYGKFSTIMAYPHVYGAPVQAPFFSNPALTAADCANQACGEAGKADAVRALNAMAAQIAAYRPTKVAQPNPGQPTPPTPPQLPWCEKAELKGLIADPEFRSLNGWRGLYGASELSLVEAGQGCRDTVVQMDARSFDILVTPVAGLRSGGDYRLQGKLMLKAKGVRETAMLAILEEGADGRLSFQDTQAVSLSITGNEFTRFDKRFTYKPSAGARAVYVAAMTSSGASLLADEVQLSEWTDAAPQLPPAPARIAYGFEDGIAGWGGFYAQVRPSTFARSGRLALEAYGRSVAGSGAGVSLLGNVEGGKAYRVSATLALGRDSRVRGSVYGYLYVEDARGQGAYQSIGLRQTAGNTWTTLQGQVQLPAGNLKRVELILLGDQPAQSLFIDDVLVQRL
ncbi:carbohydrate-binding protein [Pseudomonas mangiferae]|uniref:Carbohydrate-binding protein n=2 Tax=Pseudomonas mangiferae TaxID=2593654 RepID=A0A553H0I5_9PSED|nr:zinc-dependent metalloprotease family protein [Pseudomonas mangiferae]TRX75243.1 carbohydrate-binding protein [Pseudomonas mangiferae]